MKSVNSVNLNVALLILRKLVLVDMDFFKNVKLYREFSKVQKEDAQFLFKEFVDRHKNKLERCENVLDVGCGTGETLFDFMIPSLNARSFHVTGIDVSEKMIEFAREKYRNETQKFHVLDIQCDLENVDNFLEPESFDLVTCSYCYQWLRHEKLVFKLAIFKSIDEKSILDLLCGTSTV